MEYRMSNKWNECSQCSEEFQVIGGSFGANALFCCFCGEPLEDSDDLDEDLEFDEDE